MAIRNPNAAAETSAEESQTNAKIRKGGSPLNLLLLFVVIGLTVYGTILNFQKTGVLTHTTDLETQAKDIQSQIDTLRSSKVEVSQNAQEALKKIQTDEIRWSEVIDQVDKLVPKDSSGKDKIQILSYSGSGNGHVSLNTVTQPTSLPAFEDVANLISVFNNSVFFKNAYVPAISKGQNQDGSVTLSFVINMEYQKPETGSETLTAPVNNDASNANKVAAPKIPAATTSTATSTDTTPTTSVFPDVVPSPAPTDSTAPKVPNNNP